MGINVGDVETVLSARDTMSPTLVAAAERVAELRLRLAALGSTSTAVAAEIKMSLAQAEEAFKTLAAAATGQTTPALATTAAGAEAMNKALKGVKIGGSEAAAGVKETEEAATSAGRTLDQTAGMAQRLVERLAILYAIRGVFQFTTNLFESADALVKMNGATDMTIGKLQEIQYAAEQTGVPFTKVTTAIDTMDRKLSEAKASTGDALIGIGLSFQQVFDLNPDQRFDAIVAAIAALPTQLQRTKAEAEIFGTEALDPMIKRFGELSDAAHRNNVVMDDETVKALSNTVRMYRSFWGDISPIMGQIIDKGQKMVEILAFPIFGGTADNKDAFITSMLGLAMGGDVTAGLFATGRPRTTDIALPKETTSGGGNIPLTGQAFIDSLYAQSLATKTLTGEQWIQLQQLRDLNMLTVDNAAKLGVSTVQFKGYEDAIRQWNKETTAAIATQKEWDRAVDNLLATGLDLDTAAPADFLKAGASAKDIATYYGMAASQVRQLQMDIRDESKQEAEAAREREQAQRATDASISRTSQLWDQYGQLVARVEDGSLAARLASVDTWYDRQVDRLNKAVVSEEAYYAELDALAAVSAARRAKIVNDQHDVDERSLLKLATEWDGYYQEIEKGTGTTTQIQIAGVQRWLDNEVAHIKAGDQYWMEHYNILYATAQEKINLIIHAQDPLWLAWRGLNQDMRVEWANTWDAAFMGSESFVVALLKPFESMEHQFSKILAGMVADWEHQLLSPLLNSTNRILGGVFGLTNGSSGPGMGASVGSGMTYSSTVAAEDMLTSTATAGFMGPITGGLGMSTVAGGATIAGTAATAAVTAGISAAVIGGVALFKYLFRDKMPDDVARDAGEKFGQAWTEGLTKKVTDNTKRFHDEVAGELMSLGDIIKETPVNDSNVFMYESRVHDLFSMIETGHLTAIDAVQSLDDVFPDLAAHATDAYGRISDQLKEIIALNYRFGTESKAIADWQRAQAGIVTSGIGALIAAEPMDVYDKVKGNVDAAIAALGVKSIDITSMAGTPGFDQILADFKKSGFKGSFEQFFQQQANLYQTAPEGDPRLQTVLSGDIYSEFQKRQGAAGGAISDIINNVMWGDEKTALIDGFAEAVNHGFQGSMTMFLLQQQELYTTAQEGDPRLKTWLSSDTINALASIPAILDYNKAVAAQRDQANRAGLPDLGSQAVGAYVTSVATGSTPAEALKAVSPMLSQLSKEYKDLGLEVDDLALANLIFQNDMLSANPTLIAGVDGLGKAIAGLDNLGLETASQFATQERTGYQAYVRIQSVVEHLGGTTKDALLPMQGYLHQALIESEKLNIPLDDMTQMMIDQSKDAGIWQDQIKPKPTLIGAMETLRDVVQELVDALTNKLPKQIDIGVGFHVTNPEVPVPGGNTTEPPPQAASGALVMRGGLIRVHQDEAILNARTVARISNGGAVGSLNAGRGGGGMPTVTIGSINVYPPPGTDMTDPDQIAAAWMIALREDRQFAYTAVQIIAQRTIDAQPNLG